MARKKPTRKTEPHHNGTLPDGDGPGGAPGEETTGKYLVVFSEECVNNPKLAVEALKDSAGVSNSLTSDDYEDGAVGLAAAGDADAIVFSRLGVGVVSGNEDTLQGLAVAAGAGAARIESIEPEPIFYATQLTAAPIRDYFRGYKAAVDHLYEQMNGHDTETIDEEALAQFIDTNQFTWGLQAARVPTSRYTGRGIRVAVLDTGLDLRHPDFRGRRIISQSFVPGQAVQDGHGHGTHCIGTACGPKVPPGRSRRYGVAFGADIYVGKVLSNGGSGNGSWILAGMDWAVRNKCHVISMSLGNSATQVSNAYETAGRRALDRGSLIIAAAGNHRDQGAGQPPGVVGQPANSPSIMAIGAVDSRLKLATFSCRSNPVLGGKVDLAGPGVLVHSSWPMPTRYRTISGTSMATPHVAGIAALWAQARGAQGLALWSLLVRAARPLAIPAIDAGSGLVQAPQ